MKNIRSFNTFLKYKYSGYVARIEKFASSLGARAFRNKSQLLIKPFLSLAQLIGIDLNKSVVKVIVTYLAFCRNFQKRSNMKQLVLYLKVSSILLQKRLGGDYILNLTPLGIRVSHSKGIPRIIPKHHRARIRQGEFKIIRLWLTLFAVYRVLEVKPKISFSSITRRGKLFLLDESFFILFWKNMRKTFWKNANFHIDLLWKPFSLYKASPTPEGLVIGEEWDKKKKKWKPIFRKISTSFPSLLASWGAWVKNPELFSKLKEWGVEVGRPFKFDMFAAIYKYTPFHSEAVQEANRNKTGGIWAWESGSIKWPLFNQIRHITSSRFIGKLGLKLEPAGKLRVFAIVDPFTQWIMNPIHKFIFNLLKFIPMDGTFDQIAPVKRLLKSDQIDGLYSFDLSSATDRLPVSLQTRLLEYLIGAKLAKLWCELLVTRRYWYTLKKWSKSKKGTYSLKDLQWEEKPIFRYVKYRVGQPMGALSSWAMLALTHHFLVQYSAWKAGLIGFKNPIFTAYAILGDDVVIADARVARFYLRLCKQIGLGISLPKSIKSRKSLALEFAKRTFYKKEDVSPLTLKSFLMAKSNVASMVDFVDPLVTGPKQFLKAYGYGYKVLSRYDVPFKTLKGHARFRDRLFTYFLMKDFAETGSINQAMGRESLKFINRVKIRGFQLGGFLKETPTLFKYRTLYSLNHLIDKINMTWKALEKFLVRDDKTERSSVRLLSGVNRHHPPGQRHTKEMVLPFTWRLNRTLSGSKAAYLDPSSEYTLWKPFLHECHENKAILDELLERVYDLQERLELAKGSDFFTEVLDIESRLDSIPTTPFSKLKDPMLKTEWSKLIGFFHKSIGGRKPR